MMIYLHKLLPVVFSPIFIFVLSISYGTIKGNKKITLVITLLLYILSTPIVSRLLFRNIEGGIVKSDPKKLPNADAIVVLSGMLKAISSEKGIEAEWTDPDRFLGGIRIFRLGKSKKLIFTGGTSPWEPKSTPEGHILKRYAEQLGVPRKNIIVTQNAQNTEQETIEVKKILSDANTSIILVTSAYHMQRSKHLFEKQGFIVYEFPVDFKVGVKEITPMDFLPFPSALALTDLAIREEIGRIYYSIAS